MRVILLIMISMSILNAEFTKSGDIVTDSVSKLEWQDDRIAGSTWEGAIAQCEDLTLGGYSDWRLPNINELKSIVDRSKVNPAIVTAFENTASRYYWSSTSFVHGTFFAWVVFFGNGDVDPEYITKDMSGLFRCVRDGQ